MRVNKRGTKTHFVLSKRQKNAITSCNQRWQLHEQTDTGTEAVGSSSLYLPAYCQWVPPLLPPIIIFPITTNVPHSFSLLKLQRIWMIKTLLFRHWGVHNTKWKYILMPVRLPHHSPTHLTETLLVTLCQVEAVSQVLYTASATAHPWPSPVTR